MKLYVAILYSISAYNVRTCCEHPLLEAANLLCEATWSFPKMTSLYTNEPPMCSHLYQKATLTVSQGWRDQDMLKAGRNVTIVIVSH